MDPREQRLDHIWRTAPDLERQDPSAALALWREALTLKQDLGITGAGDIGELDSIQERITRLEGRTSPKSA